MKVLLLTNMPTPYRVDFCNCLSQYCQLTVIFEGKRTNQQKFNWIDERQFKFEYYFVDNYLNEQKIKWKILFLPLQKVYDRIVIGCYHTRTQSLLILLLKFLRRKYVFETDGGIIPEHENIAKFTFKRVLIGGATLYLSPSNFTDDYLMHYGALQDKIRRYPFTSIKTSDIVEKVLSEKEKETIRRKLGIQTHYLVLSVGQFIHRKGFDILLKAMKTVHADATLCLIGGTPTDEYNSIIKENNLTNVTFRPFLSKDELNEYYKASNLFVLPTREDIWGLVINEAMSQGLPVITTDRCVAGLELISDKNLIVPSENSVDLGKAINNILDNVSLRRAISTYNLNKIRNYTIESMAASIFKTLSK